MELAAQLVDAPLPEFQRELLDVAEAAATALPLAPHIKNRSRAQEQVVSACLELNQPARALAAAERIENWRRAAALAALAQQRAEHQSPDEARHFLQRALQALAATSDETSQDWQRERVRAKVARTHLLLGDAQLSAEFAAGVSDAEAGDLVLLQAELAADEAFDAKLKTIDEAIALGSFDQVRNALGICLELIERVYDDVERRALAEARLRDGGRKLPVTIRIGHFQQLVAITLAHGDQARALEQLDEAKLLLEGAALTADLRVPLMAGLAELRFRVGRRAEAQNEAAAALALFVAERDRFADIDRADALRPVAEAYHVLGDTAAARALYRRALDEGAANPNSRPRAEDLVATCLSMALHGVEPDAELRARLLQVRDALGPPW
ncbi:MAG: hypothetical protein ACT4PU_07125 [Planctomycetota bacterium]